MDANRWRTAVILCALFFVMAAAGGTAGCCEETGYDEPTVYGYATTSSTTYGYLAIWTLPAGSHISIDGYYWGTSDEYGDFAAELSTGSHRVEVTKNGFIPSQEYVTIWAYETTYLDVVLSADSGTSSGYTPAPTSDPYGTWYTHDDDGPVFVAATRPVY
ncbi:MAG: PEGA domain-containing protein [Methanomicrobiales archaeon]|nr:PEGA domain-containing protein [Methanomicrobiales archaeon]